MSEIIDKLKVEHRELFSLLGTIRRSGVADQTGRELISQLNEAFTNHLQWEDEEFYPAFKAVLASDKELLDTLERENQELHAVSNLVTSFVDKYAAGGNANEFIADCDDLFAALTYRVQREEAHYFPAYDKKVD